MTSHDSVRQIAMKAKEASSLLAHLDSRTRDQLIHSMHSSLCESKNDILKANEKDLESGRKNRLSQPLIDRLELNDKRFDDMLVSIVQVGKRADMLGEVIEKRELANGLELSKVRVPIGVIGVIYESRPNVTCEAASLCFKSGNAVILKGGSEAVHTNRAICEAMRLALSAHGNLINAVSFIDSTDRSSVRELVQLEGLVDLAIPRGGEGLIRSVMECATVPVIKHAKGVCHTFVDKSANIEMALHICENAKCQRPGVCNAMESLLVHSGIAEKFLPKCIERLGAHGVEFRGDDKSCQIAPTITVATESDYSTEYLDLKLSLKIVDDIDEAISHINHYGSQHSDAIVTSSREAGARFMREVNSAVVYVNASTRFTDGAVFGMGAEIGISTDKLHARGPMGAKELTTYKWMVVGNGQVRV